MKVLFLATAFVALSLLLPVGFPVGSYAADAPSTAKGREIVLIKDARFESGFTYYGTKPTRGAVEVFAPVSDRKPVWGLAQWWSKYPFAKGSFGSAADGYTIASEGAKVAVGQGADGVLSLSAYGQKEWKDAVRGKEDAWPHLLLEQKIADCPTLDRLAAVRFTIEARVVRCDLREDPGFDKRRHAARFRLNFTVQNQKQGSPGYGDFYWFTFTLFDNRHDAQKEQGRLDGGTANKRGSGKYIYSPDMDSFLKGRTLHEFGSWVKIESDIYPAIMAGLESAWANGFLADSHEPADYRLSGFNIGYELTGAFDIEAEVRGLSAVAMER